MTTKAPFKVTRSGRQLAAKMRTIVACRKAPTCYGLYVLVATLECGHIVDTNLSAEDVVIGTTKARCMACAQPR